MPSFSSLSTHYSSLFTSHCWDEKDGMWYAPLYDRTEPKVRGVSREVRVSEVNLVPLVRCLSGRYAPEGLASLTPFHRGTRCREKRGKEGVGDARSEGSERSPRLSDPFHLPLSSVSHRRGWNGRRPRNSGEPSFVVLLTLRARDHFIKVQPTDRETMEGGPSWENFPINRVTVRSEG